MKYGEWLSIWLDHYVKIGAKSRTYERYEQTVRNNIKSALGEWEMEALTPMRLQRYITELLTSGNRRTGGGLSPNTVRSIITILRNSLKMAKRMGYLSVYTADEIMPPRITERRVECFTLPEQKKIEAAVVSSPKEKLLGILICLYTGLRIGELLALTWEDVDLVKGVLSVNKTCRDGAEDGRWVRIVDTPKTESSKRLIPIPRAILPYLRAMKKRAGDGCLIQYRGKPVRVRSYQRSFELLLNRLGIPHKCFHALRHTFATRALEVGMDVKTLSEILGHKNATVTLHRYAHSMWEHKKASMDRLGKLL